MNKNACGGAEKFYKSSLAFDMGPEIQALFVEAASLVRPDKWKTWEIPGYNDFQEIKSPRSAIRYQIKNGKYGRYKWSDGSIHCTKTFGFFQKDYVGFDGFLDRLFLNKRRKDQAQRDAFDSMQSYIKRISDELYESQEYVTFRYMPSDSFFDCILYKDGSMFPDSEQCRWYFEHFDKMSASQIESFLLRGIETINR